LRTSDSTVKSMARNHTPKPLYGARKRVNDPLYCTDPECRHDAQVGYRQPDGTYDWRCSRHLRTYKPTHVGQYETRKLLAELGLV
jgi:hypothetical protein